jgi:hypothetical protein
MAKQREEKSVVSLQAAAGQAPGASTWAWMGECGHGALVVRTPHDHRIIRVELARQPGQPLRLFPQGRAGDHPGRNRVRFAARLGRQPPWLLDQRLGNQAHVPTGNLGRAPGARAQPETISRIRLMGVILPLLPGRRVEGQPSLIM